VAKAREELAHVIHREEPAEAQKHDEP